MFTKNQIKIRFLFNQKTWVMSLGRFEQSTFGKKPNRDSQEQFVAFVNRETELLEN